MPNDKEPRANPDTVTKKTTPVKKTDKKSAASTANVPAISEPVSTAAPYTPSARNPVLEGNTAIDLDFVRQRAYELYEERGRVPGHEAEDWFRAEQEIRTRSQEKKTA